MIENTLLRFRTRGLAWSAEDITE